MEQIRFQVWDYVVCALMLAATFSIGIYYAVVLRKRSNVSEYLFASGTMSFIPVTLSILASFESTLLMLGMPTESYSYGIHYVLFNIGYHAGQIVEQICLLAFVRKLNLVSPFEYLELRFRSRFLRLMGTAIGCLDILLYMSIVLYGQAIALQTVTGFSMIGSTVITTAIAVIYTSIGGLRAVVWTDVLQIIFLVGGLLVFSIKGTLDIGGVYEVWRRSTLSGRFDINTDPDITYRNNIYVFLFGTGIFGLGLLFKPPILQRVTAVKNVHHARRAVLLALLLFPICDTLALIQGLVSYSYFEAKKCDPVAAKMVDGPNQIVPFMMMEIFQHQPGLSGLFLAGIFSATLSTMSSCLSALANISFEDFVKPYIPSLTEFKSVMIAKISVLVYGGVCTGLAVLVSVLGRNSILQVFTVLTSVTKTPLAGVIYLGIFFPFVNAKSAFAGFVAGVSLLSWLVIGSKVSPNTRKHQPYPPAPIDHCPNFNTSVLTSMTTGAATETVSPSSLEIFYGFSYGIYGAVGFLPVIAVGVILGLITGGYKEVVDMKYVLPCGRNFHKYLPERLKRYFTAIGVTRSRSQEGMNMAVEETQADNIKESSAML